MAGCTDKRVCFSALCEQRKACSCTCESWFTDPVLLQKCKSACHDKPNLRHDGKDNFLRFLCADGFGQAEVYNKSGFICPNFDPSTGTEQGRKYERDKEQSELNAKAKQEAMLKQSFFLLLLLLFLGGLALSLKSKKNS